MFNCHKGQQRFPYLNQNRILYLFCEARTRTPRPVCVPILFTQVGTTFDSPHFGERPIVETLEELLHRYFYHPESRSLGPDGEPCPPKTRGRLLRPQVIGGKSHRIGKEVDRRWEEGDDLESIHQTPIEYTRRSSRAWEPLIQPSLSRSQLVKKIDVGKLIRQGFGRRIIEKISCRELVKASTYRDYERTTHRGVRAETTTTEAFSVRHPLAQHVGSPGCYQN